MSDLFGKLPEEAGNYIKFPDGTLIQWGSTSTGNTNAIVTVSLYEPFKDNNYFVSHEFTRNANTVTKSWMGDSGGNDLRTENNFGIFVVRSSGTYAAVITWLAIGRWK